jgi:hypothetical protein
MGSLRGSTVSGSAVNAPKVNIFSTIVGLGEVGLWLYCMWQQFQTTHDSIVAILQGGTMINSHMSAQDLLIFLQGNMGKFNAIATTVGLVTQLVYLGAALPSSPAQRNVWLAKGIAIGFFILEVSTDLWYSTATGTTIGGAFSWVFSFGNGGWLAALSYIAAMTYGSMFLGVKGVSRLQAAFARVF